ncbi:MAG TPA: hypothetical protein VMR34_01315 [Candidatus Saccharimonadales bacterium]|nr:hypothetical protein [Candidatus Saccharimonadales bacterium]
MKLYRFSPIESEEQLFKAFEYIHSSTQKLCKGAYGEYLPNRGTLVIFCHYDNEYKYLDSLLDKLTNKEDSFNGKYYRLKEPLVIPVQDDIPSATYTYLYIRKPDPWRSQVGDVDFVLSPEKYKVLKQSLSEKEGEKMRVFPRDDLDLLELHSPDFDVLAYIASKGIN